ncbi:MAG: alpha/beta fold hydrolase [Lysobacteraceae bacterium]
MEHLTTTCDGVQIRYSCSDLSSEKPALLFVIPFGLRLDIAQPFIDHFQDAFRVICWEARLILAPEEHPVSGKELTVERHVADLFAVLDACEVEQAHVVGYCSGAGIALAAVNLHPDRFGELVLVSGDYALLSQSACVTQFGRDIDSLLPMASKDPKTAKFILDRLPDQHKLLSARPVPEGIKLPFSQAHFFHRYALNYLSYRSTNFQELASTVNKRTLLVACERDLQTNVHSSVQIQKHIRNSSIVIEPEGDHYELLREATRVLGITRDFLAGAHQSVA